MEVSYRTISTPFGFVAFVAGARGLRRVYLPEKSEAAMQRAVTRDYKEATEDPRLLPELAAQLRAYFEGKQVEFDVRLDCAEAGAFHARVWNSCRKVGYGQTTTYKGLATKVGQPNAARAVGNAMGANPFPIVVPCHRVLKSDGSLGGYSGSQGLAFKRRLLEMESRPNA